MIWIALACGIGVSSISHMAGGYPILAHQNKIRSKRGRGQHVPYICQYDVYVIENDNCLHCT